MNLLVPTYKVCLLLLVAQILVSCSSKSFDNKTKVPKLTYQDYFLNFKTKLITISKSPQYYEEIDSTLKEISTIYYYSDTLRLKAYLWNKNIDSSQRKPAIVYFHGGFALDEEELFVCKKFIENGFIVLTPSLRGEMGNPGNFELLMGEIRDARQAVKWLAKQKWVDSTNIYTFGHSIGGAISFSLSFFDDLPIKLGGSSAGLYEEHFFESLSNNGVDIPFSISDSNEVYVRLPIFFVQYMVRRHVMYCGKDDMHAQLMKEYFSDLCANKTFKLELIDVEGDHFSSLEKSLFEFYKLITVVK